MRQQRDADAELLDLRRALVDAAGDAEPVQVERERKPADAAADNGDFAGPHAASPQKRDSLYSKIEQRLVAAGPADEGQADRAARRRSDRDRDLRQAADGRRCRSAASRAGGNLHVRSRRVDPAARSTAMSATPARCRDRQCERICAAGALAHEPLAVACIAFGDGRRRTPCARECPARDWASARVTKSP